MEAKEAVGAAAAASKAEADAAAAARLEAAVAAERKRLGDTFEELAIEVGALANVLNHDTRYKQVSHATHQLSALVQAVSAGPHSKPNAAALAALPALADRLGDELLQEACAPLSAKSTGSALAKAPTLGELSARFVDVAAAGRVAALVPPSAPGLWGHLLASLTSTLTLRAAETGHTASSHVITAAEDSLRRGDLHSAVRAVRRLEGPPARAAAGWLRAAEERLLLQTILSVATSEATVATAALAPF